MLVKKSAAGGPLLVKINRDPRLPPATDLGDVKFVKEFGFPWN